MPLCPVIVIHYYSSITLSSRLVGLLLNLMILVVTLVIMIAFFEWFLRWSGMQPMSPMPAIYQKSEIPGVNYVMQPYLTDVAGYGRETVSTNSLGLRSPEIDPARPSIVMLGDSMTFGFGVEDDQTNPAAVQQAFPEHQVINAGVNAYNIEQEVLTFEHTLKGIDPSLVILQFVINDAEPAVFVNDKGELISKQFTPEEEAARLKEAINAKGTIPIPGKYFLHTHSAIFTFIERRTKWLPFRSHGSMYGSEWPDEQFALYETWLSRLTNQITDTPRLFVIWPDGALHAKTTQRIHRLADSKGWMILDLSDYFGNHYQTLGWDHHPTAKVHKQAGEIMAETIKRMNMLPAD